MIKESSKITIDNDCLFANGIQVRSTDSHSIVDLQGNRLNRAMDIIIDSHCWICLGAIILKGTHISSNTIVGAGAVVGKTIDKCNCIVAGNPAKIVKENINWESKL